MAKPKLVDMNAEVKRLVELTSLEYDQQREAAANKLGVRVATLDMEVKAARPPAEDDTAQGKALEFKEVEPWDEEVDGVAMLDDIVALIRRHVVLDKKKAYAVTLWTVSTHTLAAASYAPRLWLWSPTKRCGKTTLLSTVSRLVLRPLPASNVSPAALFRAIEAFSPTVLIDEADAMDMHDEMRALLNSGHSREMAFVIRTVGDNHEPRQFKTFAAIALASKGKKMPDTVADRSIAIEMRRRKRDKADPGPTRLPRKGGGFVRLRRKLARWAKDHLAELNTEPGEIPEELNDRAVDNWLGLFAIADCVGGPWPKRAREAALHLSTEVDTDGDEVGVLLLGDIHDYLSREENEDADRVTSEDLLDHLQGLDERPWGEWGRTGKPISAHQLARLLRPFGITTTAGRKGKRILRGYERAPLEDAFSRYLPAETSPESATVQQTARDKGKSSSARVQQKSVLHSGKTQKVQHSSDLLHCSTSKAANGAPRVENIGGFDYYHRTLADVKARLNSRKKHNA